MGTPEYQADEILELLNTVWVLAQMNYIKVQSMIHDSPGIDLFLPELSTEFRNYNG